MTLVIDTEDIRNMRVFLQQHGPGKRGGIHPWYAESWRVGFGNCCCWSFGRGDDDDGVG